MLVFLIKRIARKLFNRLHVHIEPFYKASLESEKPGLTGWVSRPNVGIRANIAGDFFSATPVKRPDVKNAFYIDLPDLASVRQIVVESKTASGRWTPCLEYTRQEVKPVAQDASINKSIQMGLKKAILIHAFYPDILEEIEKLYKHLKHPYDIFMFIPESCPAHQSYQRNELNVSLYKKIIVGPSTGKDMGGFLHQMHFLLSSGFEYDAFAVIHTKRSPQFPENMGDAWRQMLISPILGSEDAIEISLRTLFSSDIINLVGCGDLVHTYYPIRGHGNYSRYRHLSRLFHLKIAKTDFIAGTMFWARFSKFKRMLPLEQLAIAIRELEPGSHGDPSFAHTWERFVGRLATSDGGKILGIKSNWHFIETRV
ncbi:MAG: hypothetical protein KF713_08550 [Turneriella sp.]|nr:hypothetical protein [Turneriella sp.]